MIRWYDWIVAFLAADFFIANAKVALFADVWYVNIFGAIAAYFIWDLWNDTYIPFRKRQEQKQ
jgi:hypothetical protein